MVWTALLVALFTIGAALAVWLLLRSINRNADELSHVRSEILAMSGRIDGLQRLANENRTGVQDAKDRSANLRVALDVERERLIETRHMVEQLRLGHQEKALREHGNTALVLREARRTSRVTSTRRLLLLMTLHRSASTTLFDILRGHPEVHFEPTATFWRDVGLRGRRYPLDLSNGPTADLAVEVESGVGALIPSAHTLDGNSSIAIEKAHPQFFDFDADSFADHLERVRRDVSYEIDVIYGVRKPLDAMWSMIEYQQRNPRWYQFLKPEDVPQFIERSIVQIENLHKRVPGQILDYNDVTGSSAALRRAFRGLGDSPVTDDLFEDALDAFTASNRSKLQSGRFVGEGKGERDPAGPDGAWVCASDVIANATAVYDRLRSQHHD